MIPSLTPTADPDEKFVVTRKDLRALCDRMGKFARGERIYFPTVEIDKLIDRATYRKRNKIV